MAQNATWFAQERYPDARIIVWAHNYHTSKGPEEIARVVLEYGRPLERYPDRPMGAMFADELLDRCGLLRG